MLIDKLAHRQGEALLGVYPDVQRAVGYGISLPEQQELHLQVLVLIRPPGSSSGGVSGGGGAGAESFPLLSAPPSYFEGLK
jgi:hypothetical protein